MEKIKCITFDKNAQDALPEHVKVKMKAARDKTRAEKSSTPIPTTWAIAHNVLNEELIKQ